MATFADRAAAVAGSATVGDFFSEDDLLWRIDAVVNAVVGKYAISVASDGAVLVNDVQTADFTAVAGPDGQESLWSVDVSGSALVSTLTVTAPTSPSVGDRFSVADHTLSCTTDRVIRVEFATENVMSLPAPDHATINSAGAKLVFTYIDASIGWEVASNVNA